MYFCVYLIEADRYIQLCEFHFTLLERWIVFSFICFFCCLLSVQFYHPRLHRFEIHCRRRKSKSAINSPVPVTQLPDKKHTFAFTCFSRLPFSFAFSTDVQPPDKIFSSDSSTYLYICFRISPPRWILPHSRNRLNFIKSPTRSRKQRKRLVMREYFFSVLACFSHRLRCNLPSAHKKSTIKAHMTSGETLIKLTSAHTLTYPGKPHAEILFLFPRAHSCLLM